MSRSDRSTTIPIAVLSIMVAAAIALGHPGGLDSKGGHTERKTGRYHYHRKVESSKPSVQTVTPSDNAPASDPSEMTEKRLAKLIEVLAAKGMLTEEERIALLSD